jgi:hypothetical protein
MSSLCVKLLPLVALLRGKLLLQCLVIHPLISRWCLSPLASSPWLLLHDLASVASGSPSAWGALLGRPQVVASVGVPISNVIGICYDLVWS